MKKILIWLVAPLMLASCGQNKKKADDAASKTAAAVEKTTDKVAGEAARAGQKAMATAVSIKDSLVQKAELGKVIKRRYAGVLPAADGPGIRYDLTLYNQEKSGDGVFYLSQTYLEAGNGKDMTFRTVGKWTTNRGDATDNDATVYVLMPYDKSDPRMNFLYRTDSLTMLNDRLQLPESKLNYTLRKQ